MSDPFDPDEILILGIGTRHRGDDELGLEVARRLPRLPGVRVLQHSGDGLDLLDAWNGHDWVIVVDAVASSGPPGALFRIVVGEGSLEPPWRPATSHVFGLQQALELGRCLGRLPRTLVILGVGGAEFRVGSPLSPEVRSALPRAIRAVLREVGEMSRGISSPA